MMNNTIVLPVASVVPLGLISIGEQTAVKPLRRLPLQGQKVIKLNGNVRNILNNTLPRKRGVEAMQPDELIKQAKSGIRVLLDGDIGELEEWYSNPSLRSRF
jgi:hypothetical protein